MTQNKTMIKLWVLAWSSIAFLGMSVTLYAQESTATDSLKKIVRAKQAQRLIDTQYVNALEKLTIEYAGVNPSIAVKYGHEAIAYSRTLKYRGTLPSIYRMMAIIYRNQNKKDSSEWYLRNALLVAEEINNRSMQSAIYLTIANGLINANQNDSALRCLDKAETLASETALIEHGNIVFTKGRAWQNKQRFIEAVEHYGAAERYFLDAQYPAGLVLVYTNMGVVYRAQRQVELAVMSYQKALSLQKKLSASPIQKARTLNNIGVVYLLNLRNLDSASIYLTEALSLREKVDDKLGLTQTHNNMALLYEQKNDITKAEYHARQSLMIAQQLGNATEILRSTMNLSEIQAKQSRATDALRTIITLIGADMVQYPTVGLREKFMPHIDGLRVLAVVFDSLGQFKNAYRVMQIYKDMADTVFSKESNAKLLELREQFEAAKKERQILSLEKEAELKELEILRQNALKIQQEQAIELLKTKEQVQELSLQEQSKEIQNQKLLQEQNAQSIRLLEQDKSIQALNIESQRRLAYGLGTIVVLIAGGSFWLLVLYRKKVEANAEILRQQDILETQARAIELANTELLEMNEIITEERKQIELVNQMLDVEQERSNALLLNVLPATIAERLKNGEQTIAERYESVTILFADIAGFTVLSSKISPEELVSVLDEIFSEFDGLVDKYGVEKIKTIGDCYMVVGGAPNHVEDHTTKVVRLAMEMLHILNAMSEKTQSSLGMRIGIHRGEVVAGVIGKKKFTYDLWGDAVNVASRMESHGIIGAIHVSQAVVDHLHDAILRCVPRGAIEIKGKGSMHTYFVEPIA